jgi:hypothetical protein
LDQEELLGKKLKRRKEKTIEVNRKGLKFKKFQTPMIFQLDACQVTCFF